jgi:hypothetical protein
MDDETVRRVLDPFFTTRTTRHVGLGLPLFAAAAERCEGNVELHSAPGRGTTVTGKFRNSHLDRAPLGNMTDTLIAFLLGAGECVRLHYRHCSDGRAFDLDTAEIRAELGDVPLHFPSVREWLRDYIAEGEVSLATPEITG